MIRSAPITVLGMAFLAVPAFSHPAFSHPGRTNSAGCHTCRTNCAKWGVDFGEIHCHGSGEQRRVDRSRSRNRSGSSPFQPPASEPTRAGEAISVRIFQVVDGDSFLVRHKNRTLLLALNDVDAPELDQAFGREAWLTLRRYLEGRTVQVWVKGREQEEILVDVAAGGGTNPAVRLLKEGLAWAHPKSCAEYRDLQETARTEEVGVWSEAAPEAPWDYRQKTQ